MSEKDDLDPRAYAYSLVQTGCILFWLLIGGLIAFLILRELGYCGSRGAIGWLIPTTEIYLPSMEDANGRAR